MYSIVSSDVHSCLFGAVTSSKEEEMSTILTCVLKMNEGLMGLERHNDNDFWGDLSR